MSFVVGSNNLIRATPTSVSAKNGIIYYSAWYPNALIDF